MIEDTVRTAIRQTAAQVSQTDLAPLDLDQKPQFTGPRSTMARPLTALSAAAAMIVLVIGVVVAGSAVRHAGDSGQSAAKPSGPPRYFVDLSFSAATGVERDRADIVDSLTGKVIAFAPVPKPYGSFTEAAAAANDRTFVLAAQTETHGPHWLSKLFVLRFDPVRKTASLRPLRFTFPATLNGRKVSWVGQGLALTPDGTELAIAASPFERAHVSHVWTYSMASGTSRSWHSPGEIGLRLYDSRAISWSGDDRTLSYLWSSEPSGLRSMQLLNTAAPQGDLISHSRKLVKIAAPGFAPWRDADLTPDGSKLVAAVQAKVPTIEVLPGSPSGHATKSLDRLIQLSLPAHHRLFDVLWTNSAASAMVVSVVDRHGNPTLMLLRGHKLVKLSHLKRVGSDTTAW